MTPANNLVKLSNNLFQVSFYDEKSNLQTLHISGNLPAFIGKTDKTFQEKLLSLKLLENKKENPTPIVIENKPIIEVKPNIHVSTGSDTIKKRTLLVATGVALGILAYKFGPSAISAVTTLATSYLSSSLADLNPLEKLKSLSDYLPSISVFNIFKNIPHTQTVSSISNQVFDNMPVDSALNSNLFSSGIHNAALSNSSSVSSFLLKGVGITA